MRQKLGIGQPFAVSPIPRGLLLGLNFRGTLGVETLYKISTPLENYNVTLLRAHLLCDAVLQTIYRAVFVARLLYTASAQWGFTTADSAALREC